MSKSKTVRFAVGSPDLVFSGVWRLVVKGKDAYLGASKSAMSIFKISLHKSGVWVLAATQQSGATFENGNRRARRWTRPLEHAKGVTRGPSIFVPRTSLGSRPLPPDEDNQNVIWYKAPEVGETAEFSIYFVKPNTPVRWTSNETVLAECPLADGGYVALLASKGDSPKAFEATFEKLLSENIVRTGDPTAFRGGSFLWVTDSQDDRKIPVIVDLPVPIGPS